MSIPLSIQRGARWVGFAIMEQTSFYARQVQAITERFVKSFTNVSSGFCGIFYKT